MNWACRAVGPILFFVVVILNPSPPSHLISNILLARSVACSANNALSSTAEHTPALQLS